MIDITQHNVEIEFDDHPNDRPYRENDKEGYGDGSIEFEGDINHEDMTRYIEENERWKYNVPPAFIKLNIQNLKTPVSFPHVFGVLRESLVDSESVQVLFMEFPYK